MLSLPSSPALTLFQLLAFRHKMKTLYATNKLQQAEQKGFQQQQKKHASFVRKIIQGSVLYFILF